ncbi:MAG: type II secretion system protein [Pirellulales bacterium]
MSQGIAKRGVTLVEMIVVLAIIAMLLGLLLPAIHYSRESARRAGCQGNLHQLGAAMLHYLDVHHKLPDPAKDGMVGGWVIAILPFMEESALADEFARNPSLDPTTLSPLAHKRPFLLTCPSAYEGDSSIATVPASHYSAILHRTGRQKQLWEIGELTTDSRLAWVASPEVALGGPEEVLPHRGGYNAIDGYGGKSYGVIFRSPH